MSEDSNLLLSGAKKNLLLVGKINPDRKTKTPFAITIAILKFLILITIILARLKLLLTE